MNKANAIWVGCALAALGGMGAWGGVDPVSARGTVWQVSG